jgi:hypothetical protein
MIAIMQFDGQFTLNIKQIRSGIKQFKYSGTRIDTTRDFCARHIGVECLQNKKLEIYGLILTWKGKSGSDPFIDRGGYRCRHSFIVYNPEWETILDDELNFLIHLTIIRTLKEYYYG